MGDDTMMDDASAIEEMLNMISSKRWYLLICCSKIYIKKLI
jgi:hypothetical protein